MGMNYKASIRMGRAMLAAIAQGPPDHQADQFSEEHVKGVQSGTMLSVIPFCVIAGRSEGKSTNEVFDDLDVPQPMRDHIRQTLIPFLRKMVIAAAEGDDEETIDINSKQTQFGFDVLDVIKATMTAAFAEEQLVSRPPGMSDEQHDAVELGMVTMASALVYALSEQFNTPIEQLCDLFGINKKHWPAIQRAAELTAVLKRIKNDASHQ